MDYATAYSILGLPFGAGHPEVKSAYRRLTKELHPDNVQADGKSRERLLLVTEAYDLLDQKYQREKNIASLTGTIGNTVSSNAGSGNTEAFPTGNDNAGNSREEAFHPGSGCEGAGNAGGGKGPRIYGTPVSYHVTSAEERLRHRQRENDYRKNAAEKRAKAREEALRRADELKAEKLQKQKERALLNEIRMIRLAHIIEATIAADQKKGQKE